MDRQEASEVAEARLRRLRALSYDELLTRYSTNAEEEPTWEMAAGASGGVYHLRIEAFWDSVSEPEQNLRVWVEAEDGVDRPVITSFIIKPDGSFVGE
jgi:hypothetical protein